MLSLQGQRDLEPARRLEAGLIVNRLIACRLSSAQGSSCGALAQGLSVWDRCWPVGPPPRACVLQRENKVPQLTSLPSLLAHEGMDGTSKEEKPVGLRLGAMQSSQTAPPHENTILPPFSHRTCGIWRPITQQVYSCSCQLTPCPQGRKGEINRAS